jgi:hypothetical protein
LPDTLFFHPGIKRAVGAGGFKKYLDVNNRLPRIFIKRIAGVLRVRKINSHCREILLF